MASGMAIEIPREIAHAARMTPEERKPLYRGPIKVPAEEDFEAPPIALRPLPEAPAAKEPPAPAAEAAAPDAKDG